MPPRNRKSGTRRASSTHSQTASSSTASEIPSARPPWAKWPHEIRKARAIPSPMLTMPISTGVRVSLSAKKPPVEHFHRAVASQADREKEQRPCGEFGGRSVERAALE